MSQVSVLPESAVDSITEQQARVGLQAILRAFALWEVSDSDAVILLGCNRSDIPLYVEGKLALHDRKDITLRISYFLGIFADLVTQFGHPLCYQWVKLPNNNSLFDGKSPLYYMKATGLEGIARTRNYVSELVEYVGFG